MSGSSAKFLKRVLRDKRQATYFSLPKSVLAPSIEARITGSKNRKAEAKRRFKAELAELRSSWEAHIAKIAERFTLPSSEAASLISLAKPKA